MNNTGYLTIKNEQVFEGDLFDIGGGDLGQVSIKNGEWFIGLNPIDYYCNGVTKIDFRKIGNIATFKLGDENNE